ncbi:Scr1 family TA system antitoxin-like transcriptional regulator [Solwaraspora sp. WMMA2080]|uniref:Scr1 family TA system antitoxin-like transcriptional regulator n=1 Tax=unclassified Solwaraspora TaxID=2627926 RepID=UPI00248A910A|nr:MULTISPECIES: Scr1 family TA system antitoxin-like transcriptional regulator [unclassified Solwaraspora]WBB97004.1 Scr1 family TA system antitoxin-like transcriptional regulator [Solwaraspora sp. WMMA2059]WBC19093.1 Scr1 family TA system antitoxin-like transcriptional regulator [Solwaraspora sp. WMMA2080]
MGAARRGWWQDYAKLFPNEFLRFLGYEAGASQLRSFRSEAIHGLLQTEEYARAAIRGGSTTIRLAEVERWVDVRMARQVRLAASDPIRINTVISEGALRQQVGGPAVM